MNGRLRKNLTLTLGIRYEYSSPKEDTQGRSFSLAFGQQSQRFPGAPTGVLFPGDPNAPKGSNFPDKNDWAPRFGFAWDPKGDGKMSVRGGFGVFYDILKGEDNLQFNGQAPFFGFVDVFNSLDSSSDRPHLTISATRLGRLERRIHSRRNRPPRILTSALPDSFRWAAVASIM